MEPPPAFGVGPRRPHGLVLGVDPGVDAGGLAQLQTDDRRPEEVVASDDRRIAGQHLADGERQAVTVGRLNADLHVAADVFESSLLVGAEERIVGTVLAERPRLARQHANRQAAKLRLPPGHLHGGLAASGEADLVRFGERGRVGQRSESRGGTGRLGGEHRGVTCPHE